MSNTFLCVMRIYIMTHSWILANFEFQSNSRLDQLLLLLTFFDVSFLWTIIFSIKCAQFLSALHYFYSQNMKISFWICSLSSWKLIYFEYCSWRLFDPIYIITLLPTTLLMHSLLCHQSAFTYECIHTSSQKSTTNKTRQKNWQGFLACLMQALQICTYILRKVLPRKSWTSH